MFTFASDKILIMSFRVLLINCNVTVFCLGDGWGALVFDFFDGGLFITLTSDSESELDPELESDSELEDELGVGSRFCLCFFAISDQLKGNGR